MGDPFELPPGDKYIPLLHDPEVGQSGAAKSSVPPPDKDDLRLVTLYGVLGGFFVAAIWQGVTLYDSHPWFGGGTALFGIAGLSLTVIFLIRYRPKTVHALIVTTAGLIAALAFLAYVIWTKPKEVIVHDPPTAEDIEKATAPTKAERDTAIKERDTARQELEAARRSVISPPVVLPPTPQPEWSNQEIAIRVDLWHSIQNALNDTVKAYNLGDGVLNMWETYIPQQKDEYLKKLALFRKNVSEAADVIQKLRRDYPNFQDISTTIDQPYLGPLLDSINNFSNAISTSPETLTPSSRTTLRQLAGAVRVQMSNFVDWTSNVRSTAGSKLNQLQTMIHK